MEPTSLGERFKVAQTCRDDLGLKVPMLIDDMRNSADASYSGWPDRLFLVGTDGKIAYRGGRGPRGFSVPELEKVIKKLVKTKPASAGDGEKDLEAIRAKLRAQRKASMGK